MYCVNCDYEGNEFDAEVAGIKEGTFTYKAKCPCCGSLMVFPDAGDRQLSILDKKKEKQK